MMADSPKADGDSKYQKLAQEYSKAKAQNSVLKKALLEEQSKSSKLKEDLRHKEQALRKLEQEIDSFQFRNQQLTKRIEVLQNEIDSLEHDQKKRRNRSESQPEKHLDVLDQELQLKIEENEFLHVQLEDSKVKLVEDKEALNYRISQLETEISRNNVCTNKLKEAFQSKIISLESERDKLFSKNEHFTSLLSEKDLKLSQMAEEVNRLKNTLNNHSSSMLGYKQKIPFLDLNVQKFNNLNILYKSKKEVQHWREVVHTLYTILQDFITQLVNFYSHYHQRIRYMVEGSFFSPSLETDELMVMLEKCSGHLRPVQSTFRQWSDSYLSDDVLCNHYVDSFGDFCKALLGMLQYQVQLIPLMLKSIEGECCNSLYNISMETKSMEIHCALGNLLNGLNMLQKSVIQVEECSSRSCVNGETLQTILTSLIMSSVEMNSAYKELHLVFANRMVDVQANPKFSSQFKSIEETISHSLNNLVNISAKWSELLMNNLSYICGEPRVLNFLPIMNSSSVVSKLYKRATSFLSSLDLSEDNTVPYDEAIENKQALNELNSKLQNMEREITFYQEKVNKLEQLKEHWMLEYQLLKIKLEKSQQISEIEHPDHKQHDVSLDEMVKKFFVDRINELVHRNSISSSKLITFQNECEALQRRLEIYEQEKLSLRDSLRERDDKITQIKEELKDSVSNYKTQLSVMSEHVASLNQMVTDKNDKIESLNYQLNSKTSNKKGRK